RTAPAPNRPMPQPTLSANNARQAPGSDEVHLPYPAKWAGAPPLISRFVQRLAAVAGKERWDAARARGAQFVAWARALDQPAERKPVKRPEPRPPRAARPTALSVTDIEHWLRDPYTIYAKHILDLRELDAVDLPPGAAPAAASAREAPASGPPRPSGRAPPADPAAALIEIGAKHFAALEDYPEARAFWWPRFQRIARWFAGWETQRRGRIAALAAETSGKIEIPLGERGLTLRGRADRIERLAGGRHPIIQFKTGQVPTEKQVRIGMSPQLTLEAAILRRGGFAGHAAGAGVAELVYVSLKGGSPPGEDRPIAFKDGDADVQAERALARLTEVA